MSCKNGLTQIIKVTLTDFAAVALAFRLSLIPAVFDDLIPVTPRTSHSLWPASLANQLLAFHIIN